MNEIKRRHFQPEKKFEIVKEAIQSLMFVKLMVSILPSTISGFKPSSMVL